MAQGVDDHTDTDEDEGDAEELTLIESDGLNKLVLPRLLDELDDRANTGYARQAADTRLSHRELWLPNRPEEYSARGD